MNISKVGSIFLTFFTVITRPRSKNLDTARREFILNILLVGLIVLTVPAFLLNIFKSFVYLHKRGENPLVTGSVLVVFIGLLVLSRKGKSYFASSIFIFILILLGISANFRWGPDLPQILLIYSLTVVMAGILINSRFAFIISVINGTIILVFSYLKIHGLYHTDDRWRIDVVHFSDAIVYAITLFIIALVSWLFNRESERALRRARISEMALKRQRDRLEIVVEERTAELKRVQAEKLSQLYRFAEFGRTASGLFHDLVNPLNLVSLNLDLLKKHNKKVDQQKISETKVLLKRAISGTQRLESFVDIARKQVQSNDKRQTFSLVDEVKESLQMLEYKASKAYVTVTIQPSETILFFGNPIKFNQLVTNVVSNAIDAYDTVIRKPKRVEIKLQKLKNMLRLEIQDFGIGIKEEMLLNIFDPFFTTKSPGKAMGMGLAICKEIVEKELQGKITVVSKRGEGTTFTIAFPLKKAPQSRN